MLIKKQLEDAANCSDCTNCCHSEMVYGPFGDGPVCKLEMVEIAQTALANRSMLERLEWVEVGDREGEDEMIPAILCPSCDNWKEEGHKPDCALAALLSEVPHET